jgi:hypothetical protein
MAGARHRAFVVEASDAQQASYRRISRVIYRVKRPRRRAGMDGIQRRRRRCLQPAEAGPIRPRKTGKSGRRDALTCRIPRRHHGVLALTLRWRMSRTRPGVHEAPVTLADCCCCVLECAMTQQPAEYDRGLLMVGSASGALGDAGLEHWFFGGWAVDLWVGRLTRPHDDIVSTRRSGEPAGSTRGAMRCPHTATTPVYPERAEAPV